MMHWIKRTARLLGMVSFFIVFFLGIDPNDPFNTHIIAVAFAKGLAGALLLWLSGFIIADIVIKGLITDVRTNEDDTLEGGILQRLHSVQSSLTPEALDSVGDKDKELQETKKAKAPKA
jgi:hypothetical protein